MLVKSLVQEYPGALVKVYDGETCIWNNILNIDNYHKFLLIMNKEVITYEFELCNGELELVIDVL